MRLIWLALILCIKLHAQEIRVVQVASGIPDITDIQNAGDGSGRLFLVQQSGLVRTLRNGTLAPAPFLDVRNKTSAGGERGLLGMAFAPNFARTQRLYVDYTDLNGDTVIAQYRMAAGGESADPSTETVL